MKQPHSALKGNKPVKARRKSREEIDQESRQRKRQKKHRGHQAGSRSSGAAAAQGDKKVTQNKDPRIGSKNPIPLNVSKQSLTKQAKPKINKPVLTPQAELDMLEQDERLDGLLERLESGDRLSREERDWLDATLSRIDFLMDKLGISWESEDEEEEEKTDDLMRLLKGGD